jgi:hypothetical protein
MHCDRNSVPAKADGRLGISKATHYTLTMPACRRVGAKVPMGGISLVCDERGRQLRRPLRRDGLRHFLRDP